MDTPTLVCPNCGNILVPGDAFCPKCGAKVENQAQSVGIGKQIYVYFVSFFLPPFGLIWAWKYMRSSSSQMKRVGIVAIVLTIAGIFLTIWTTMGFLQGMQAQLNSYSNLGL
ncbi:MAG TPA: zinc-ribbon domain-containing protein [Candidatus Eisenbacteria bacterium]|nr:zinc-ribbon domain-containing protein [Candidatus Eisenbacteria bacterium]